MLYQKTFGGRAGNPSEGLPEEHLKYRKLFSLQFNDEYVVAKRRVVERASGRGISLASYPRFFLEDFANFSTVIARHWKRRWGAGRRCNACVQHADAGRHGGLPVLFRRNRGTRHERSIMLLSSRGWRAKPPVWRAKATSACVRSPSAPRRWRERSAAWTCPGRTLPGRRRSTGLRSRRAGQPAATAAHPVHVRYRRFAGPRPAEIRLRLR